VGKKPNKSFDKDGKFDKKVRGLQAELKEKEKYIKQLESQLRTLESAFKKAAGFMSKESKELSVEELISAANKDYTLEQARKNAPVKKDIKPRPPTKDELEQKKLETLEKVRKWRRENIGEYEEE